MDESNPSGTGNQEQQEEFDAWNDDQGTDDDEVHSEEVSPEVMTEILGKGMKSGPTIDDLKQMKDALNDKMRIRCNSGEEHQDHLDQIKSYLESKIVWETKKEVFIFADSKETNSDIPKLRKLKQIDDPKEVYPEQRIIDVIRVEYNQGYGQEYMKEIVVKRADGEYKSFIESDYEYLHKNGIEDMYLMCMDESYQVNVNLTAPNLIFPSIEEKKLYIITSLPLVGLIYDNSKKEKRIMDIDEIPKFCDATLKRVLKAELQREDVVTLCWMDANYWDRQTFKVILRETSTRPSHSTGTSSRPSHSATICTDLEMARVLILKFDLT
ncbi:hypothetical protein Tco_0731318 [Tanacetum coccineum]